MSWATAVISIVAALVVMSIVFSVIERRENKRAANAK